MSRPKVVLVGDTARASRHFGCQLVCETFREQFERTGLELTRSFLMDLGEEGTWEKTVEGADLVVINGEGSFHHGRYQKLLHLAEIRPVVLVNTVWEENPQAKSLKKILFLAARESRSANEIRKNGVACTVVPDVLFASRRLLDYQPNDPGRGLGQTDSTVKDEIRLGPVRWRTRRGFSPKVLRPEIYLDKLCRYERLCIGRFHAAIAAAVLGRPFATWDSNTWKLRGLMEDMGMEHLHFEYRKDARKAVPYKLDNRVRDFAHEARKRVERMFDQIASLAREWAE